jgi:hypothetical protein
MDSSTPKMVGQTGSSPGFLLERFAIACAVITVGARGARGKESEKPLPYLTYTRHPNVPVVVRSVRAIEIRPKAASGESRQTTSLPYPRGAIFLFQGVIRDDMNDFRNVLERLL